MFTEKDTRKRRCRCFVYTQKYQKVVYGFKFGILKMKKE
jgi:hypothetical protein